MAKPRVFEEKNRYFLAIDFDGTLVEHAFPDVGPKKISTIRKLDAHIAKMEEQGYEVILILWTCREGHFLDDAIRWCKTNYDKFTYYNENPLFVQETGVTCRKIFANEYWDDRAIQVK